MTLVTMRDSQQRVFQVDWRCARCAARRALAEGELEPGGGTATERPQ